MSVAIGDPSTPVLVLNAIHHGALGLSRSLGRLGVKVYNQAPFRSVPVFYSKYSRGNFVWNHDTAGADRTVQFLLSIGQRLSSTALLIPTCDVTATLVADHDETLRQYFIFPKQPPALVHALCSKKGMYHLAKAHGIATPETIFPESRAEVLRFLESTHFPIVLKTVKNTMGTTTPRAVKIIVTDEQKLLALYDQLEDSTHPNLMLQEYIPGNDDKNCMFNGYFDENSTCLVAFTGKKLRQFPAYAGVTSLGMCVRDATVEDMTKKFMRAIGYRGVIDMGYRFDERDQKYKIYDVNPRIGATFRLFVDDKGMDVARALYLDMTGQPVQPGHMREGRKWIVEDSDLVSSFRYGWDGRLQFKDWMQSLRGVEEGALFASDDLIPVGARMIHNVRKLFLPPIKKASRNQPAQPAAIDENTSTPTEKHDGCEYTSCADGRHTPN
ncbi:MAG: carboxylate--amine ligase [Acidobacteriota bacterium]|nr:carboxylate--amine ligase [Acidobacteriota bacterium]